MHIRRQKRTFAKRFGDPGSPAHAGNILPAVATRLPAATTGSRSSTQSKPATATADDTVDQALSDFNTDSLDDDLLEDLAAALVE